ncbi:MAG: RNA polymerase sigma-70 factor, ECF subfamily [Parcubacteria group bacterium Gr01-1014_30]|nr:MAG: RNA polymerase sigma-70 factor, ECF subfamily [Parcubacteria group bacterium Gr01-1014_30]
MSKREEFGKIYDDYIEKIYRFIFLKVSSQEVAQDLTSETFLRTWEKFKEGGNNPIENPRAFLYQTARNLVVDHYRDKAKFQVVSVDATPIVDSAADLEKRAIVDSDLSVVKASLADLKEDYQNVIIWHYLDDLPMPAVAKLLDRTEEATRVLLHRALKSLKQKINEV